MFAQFCPNLRLGDNGEPTSGQDPLYNCVAHAVQTELAYIWPDALEQYPWPPAIPREESVDAFVEFFRACGFQPCNDAAPESGFEKVVIYVNGGSVAHVARQLPSGHWTSKMGDLIDFSHSTLAVAADGLFGQPVQAVRRPDTGSPPVLPPLNPPLTQMVNSSGAPLD